MAKMAQPTAEPVEEDYEYVVFAVLIVLSFPGLGLLGAGLERPRDLSQPD